jgi:hypothetical protein
MDGWIQQEPELHLFDLAHARKEVSDEKTADIRNKAGMLNLADKSLSYISGLPPDMQVHALNDMRQHLGGKGIPNSYFFSGTTAEEAKQYIERSTAYVKEKYARLKEEQELQLNQKKLNAPDTTAGGLSLADQPGYTGGKPTPEQAKGAVTLMQQSHEEEEYITPDHKLIKTASPETLPPGSEPFKLHHEDVQAEALDKRIKAGENKPETGQQDKQRRINIEQRKNLGEQTSPQDDAWAKAYDKVGTENVVAGAQARGQAYGDIRIQNYYDNQLGKEVTMSATDFNQKQKEEPGRYNLTTPSATEKNVQKVAYVNDLKNRMTAVWSDLDKMPEWTEAQRGALILTAKEHDPSSAISQFMGGEFGKTLTDEQTDYLIHVRQLNENVLGMRNLTQGSPAIEKVVAAIEKTVPGMLTPNKKFAYKQLNALNEQLADLEKGFAKVNVPGTKQSNNLIGTAPKNLIGKPPAHYKTKSGDIIKWDGSKVIE